MRSRGRKRGAASIAWAVKATAFSLKAAVGFPCKSNFVCTGDNLQCFFDAGGAGACQTVVKVDGGSNCEGVGVVCPAGKFCFTSQDAGKICKDKEVTGAACGIGTRECADGNFCQLAKDESGTLTRSGLCVQKFDVGTACGADQECATGRCGTVNTANGQQGRCLNNIIFGGREPYCDNFR